MKTQNYRNIKEVLSYEGILVDAGSLWERKGDLMILVDEDQYVTTFYDKDLFED
ncbi:hypothetical protein [Chryseobacterium vrystaatense]|uniref:hypothetical protein n=1 Tax=Chryseobacterium vrystaatense TaxID=307480 RepID=UPI000AA6629A|nr:hypothetical protein [Chryseobacterium vrystaatense]